MKRLFVVVFGLFLVVFISACKDQSVSEVKEKLTATVSGDTLISAPVQTGKKWGYIDRTGRYVINPQFDCASAI